MSGATMKNTPIRRHLVMDEIEEIPDKRGNLHRFRVRVWRALQATPVVLVSQVDGGVAPQRLVNKLSNYVFSAILGYPEPGMLYFQHDTTDDELTQVFFEFFGNARRLRLYRPIDQLKSWLWLEYMVGETIPH